MNSMDDLRSTLDRRAEALDDTDRYVRAVAVRSRIRVARRRRAGAVAVAAAAALVLGAVGVGALRTPGTIEPADVVGVDVPRQVEVLGFPYALDDTDELGAGDHHRFGDTDDERAVTLVGSGLGSGSATLVSDGVAIARVRTGEPVSVPVPVAAGELSIRYDATPSGAAAGIAVYEATGELAAGVDNGKAVFRESYAGQRLLGAGFSAPGESTVDFEADGARSMRFVTYCDGPSDLFVNVDIDGKPGLGFGCGGAGTDAAAGSSGSLDQMGLGTHDIHVYVNRDGSDGPPVDADDVTVGAGVYAETDTVEYAGRVWRLASETTPKPGDAVRVDTSDGDVLLGVAGRGDLGVIWKGALDSGRTHAAVRGTSTGSTLAGVLLAGDTYDVTPTGNDSRLRVYRPE